MNIVELDANGKIVITKFSSEDLFLSISAKLGECEAVTLK